MEINLRLLIAFSMFWSALPVTAGITARPCPSKCDYGQSSQASRNFCLNPDDAWLAELEEYFKNKVNNLSMPEQIAELKKEIKKLRKQLYEISKKANFKME